MQGLFVSSTIRWRRALRIAVAGSIGGFFALWLDPDNAFWTLIAVYILSMPDVGTSLIKVANRLIGTAVGAGLSVVIVAMFPQTLGAAYVCFALAVCATLYLSYATQLAPHAFFLTAVTLIIVGTSVWSDPTDIAMTALGRFTNIAIGIVAVYVSWQIAWPVKGEDYLTDGMRTRIDRADQRLANMDASLTSGSVEKLGLLPPGQSEFAGHIAALTAAAAESASVKKHHAAWLGAITLVDRFASQVSALEGLMMPAELSSLSSETSASLRHAIGLIRRTWQQANEALHHGQPMSKSPLAIDETLGSLDRALASGTLDPTQSIVVSTMQVLLRHLPQAHALVVWVTTGQDEAAMFVDAAGSRTQGPLESLFHGINHNALKTAVKATLAAAITMVLAAALHWKVAGGIAVVTTVLIMQPTIGASLAKGWQRIAGALLGGFAGLAIIAVVMANTNDLAMLLAVVFVVSLITGWAMGGPWDSAYVGLQFGIVLVFTFLDTAHASSSLTHAFDRIYGIMLGLIVVCFVLRALWPVRAGDRLLESLSQCVRTMADVLEVGLRDPIEETRMRPMYGWRYRMAWLLADAYRFREEARFEHGIGFGQGMPSLQLGVSIQDAMLRSLLIVRNRVDCPEWLTILSRHPAARELRTASQQALRNVANILDGKPEEPVDLDAVIERVRPIVLQEAKDALIRDRSAIETHLGFFEELVSALKPMPQQARETRLKFA